MLHSLKIRTKIFLAIFLPVLLAITMIVYLIHFHFERRIISEYEQIAIQDSHEKARVLANTFSQFKRMANQIAISIPNMNNWQEYLTNKQKIFPEIQAVFVVNRQGKLLFQSIAPNGAVALPKAIFRDLFSQAVSKGAILLSPSGPAEFKNRIFVLSSTTQIQNSPSPVGVLLELDIPYIFRSVLGFGGTANRIQYYFVDQKDRILFSGQKNDINRKLTDVAAFKKLERQEFTHIFAPKGIHPFETLDSREKNFLYIEPLEFGQFAIVERENLIPVIRAFQASPRFLGILIAFILLVIMIISEILATHVSNPLRSLVAALGLYHEKGFIPPMEKITRRRDEYGILAKEALSYIQEIENKNQEIRRAFEKLKLSEERYFQFLNHSPNLILVTEDHHLVFANQKARELFGNRLGTDEPLADTIGFKNLQGKITSLFEVPRFYRNFPVEGTLLLDDQEIPIFLYHAQFSFKSTKNELFLLVDVRRIKELEIQEKQMEWKLIESNRLASLGILTAGIAHNLYNPLASIIGLGEILKMKYPDEKQVNAILEAANQMEKTILLVTDRNRHEVSNRKMKIDLNALLSDSIRLLEMNHRLHLQFEKNVQLDPKVPPIWGRYGDFSVSLEAFLYNAVEAMEKSEQRTLTAQTRFLSDQIEIRIGDTGPGIAREDLDKIFLPFFTTKISKENENDRNQPNLGLGLFVAHHLLEVYGAKIDVNSQTGRGTTFIIRIPVRPKGKESEEKSQPGNAAKS